MPMAAKPSASLKRARSVMRMSFRQQPLALWGIPALICIGERAISSLFATYSLKTPDLRVMPEPALHQSGGR
jgi:hypothetical protein